MNVPFQMVYRNQRLAQAKCVRLRERNADQQRSCQSRTGGHGDRIQIFGDDGGLLQCLAYHRDDVPQMFSAGQFRHHTTVQRVHFHL